MLSLPEILSSVFAKNPGMTDGRAAQVLCVHRNTLRNWRYGDHLPNEETMLALCGLADIEPQIGLLLLNIWRSEGRARATYMAMLKRIEGEKRITPATFDANVAERPPSIETALEQIRT